MRHRLLGYGAIAALLASVAACDTSASTTPNSAGQQGSAGSDASQASPYIHEDVDIGGRAAVSVRILGSPDWLAADDEHVYVSRDEGGFTTLDPTTAEVVGSFSPEGTRHCQGIGAGGGPVWTCAEGDLVAVDSAGDIEASIPVTKAADQGHLIVAFGRVWILAGDGSSLVGIDTESHAPGEPIAVPVRGTDLAVSADRLWVVSSVDGAVVDVDPESGAVGRRVDGLAGARAAVAIPGALWVGGSLVSYRVDIVTGSVTATVEGGIGNDGGIGGDDSGIWVRRGGVTLQHLDPATGAVREELSAEIAESGRGGDVLVAFDALWVSFYEDATLIRIPLG